MEKLFQLKKHNTNVRTEVIGGLTTFFAMAYIIFVNPNFLSQTGMDHTAVMLATCISAAIGCFLTAFMANVPFAQAPGMGLNAFFTYTICFGMGYTWQQGLAIVFISGLIFLAVSVSPIRKQIIDSIPAPLKAAISAGIGLFICLIGLLNAGIVTAGNNLLDLSNITSGPALLALIADAVATCTGALMGTSTVTTFVESSTGISEGARTGLSSVVVGILFLLGCVLAPIAGIIPSAATAPALIIVGMFMIGNVAKIDWSDVEVALPCFLTIAMMPFAYSISDGIGFGFISYTLIKMARGKFKEVPVLLYILSALFVVMYILAAL